MFSRKRLFFTKSIDKGYTNDPIESVKAMVSLIQQFVGIRNMFGDENSSFSILSLLKMLLFGGSFVYVGSLSQLIYLVRVFPDKMETFKALNCISATCVPLSKYVFMWSVRTRLRTIFVMSKQGLSAIESDTTGYSKMIRTLKTARSASWFVIINQSVTHVIYLLIPFLFTIFGNIRYLPTTPGETYGLTPKYETPYYEITFMLTCFATIFSAVNQTGYIVLFINLLAHELGHFYVITDVLNGIFEKNDADRDPVFIDRKLKFCAKHYQYLLKFHNEIKNLYKIIFGAHFLMMTIVLVTTLQTMNSWDIRNTVLTAVTGIMPLFIYCFGGELLITAGMDMSTAIYQCGWEKMGVKQAKVVSVILCLSQRPLCLTAANVFVMNRETFGGIAQVVYKIYAVFN
uniref:Odorant receptor n=3 Tax=Bombyx mori TaxID=7091 RepID=A0A8R2C7V7_BOMMO|nr:olfactory receptor 49 isoform X1 [Bombyx mori]